MLRSTSALSLCLFTPLPRPVLTTAAATYSRTITWTLLVSLGGWGASCCVLINGWIVLPSTQLLYVRRYTKIVVSMVILFTHCLCHCIFPHCFLYCTALYHSEVEACYGLCALMWPAPSFRSENRKLELCIETGHIPGPVRAEEYSAEWADTSHYSPTVVMSCRNAGLVCHSFPLMYLGLWVWNSVSDIKGGTQTEGVWEQGAEENIWTEEGWSDRRLKRTA
jgi:hypothetical protein